jgi:hypothetical protein
VSPGLPYARAARRVSTQLLADIGPRWRLVQHVARAAHEQSGHLDPDERDLVVASAWLHDVGYATSISLSGLHSLDGARHINILGYPQAIIGLVAYHTGAMYEAEERGLLDQLLRFDPPPERLLDALTLADLSVGPGGSHSDPEDRIAEILQRYEPEHPVHRAVLSSRESLMASVQRALARQLRVQRDMRGQPT